MILCIIMYENLINKCEDCIDECNSLENEKVEAEIHHRESKKIDVTDHEVLKNNTKIESFENGKKITIRLMGLDSGLKYAEARYVQLESYSVGVIDWIEVHSDIRGNGIGRLIRSEVVSNMNNIDTIYSKIINDKLITVAIDQGFKKIKYGGLEGWFILN